jgi:hypothetical protein
MTLINSRPASPREDEIAAIIEGAVPTAHSGQISDLDARIRKLSPWCVPQNSTPARSMIAAWMMLRRNT